MDIIFRELKITDREDLVELFKGLADKKPKLEMEKLIRDKNFNAIVVEFDGRVIGFGSISFYNAAMVGTKGVIEDIIVNMDFENKGIGTTILKTLIGFGKKREAQIWLTSNPKRIKARRLYEGLGFRKYDTGVYILD